MLRTIRKDSRLLRLMMADDPKKVLVLCTGNSCRSVIAEALINHLSRGCYRAWSAGSSPAGYVHPKAIETLKRHGIDPGAPQSKSWDVFANEPFDLLITVCDQAAGESCPVFSDSPQSFTGVFPTRRRRRKQRPKSTPHSMRLSRC